MKKHQTLIPLNLHTLDKYKIKKVSKKLVERGQKPEIVTIQVPSLKVEQAKKISELSFRNSARNFRMKSRGKLMNVRQKSE